MTQTSAVCAQTACDLWREQTQNPDSATHGRVTTYEVNASALTPGCSTKIPLRSLPTLLFPGPCSRHMTGGLPRHLPQ